MKNLLSSGPQPGRPRRFASARFVRYADDWVITARYIGPRIHAFVDKTLTELDLILNRAEIIKKIL